MITCLESKCLNRVIIIMKFDISCPLIACTGVLQPTMQFGLPHPANVGFLRTDIGDPLYRTLQSTGVIVRLWCKLRNPWLRNMLQFCTDVCRKLKSGFIQNDASLAINIIVLKGLQPLWNRANWENCIVLKKTTRFNKIYVPPISFGFFAYGK